MIEKCMIDLNEAIVFVFSLLILPKELGDVLISLEILILEFVKPFFSLFDTNLFHRVWEFKL